MLGIDKYPAVVDRDFIDATLRWQAVHNLTQDGKFGPTATWRLVRELAAEDQARLARPASARTTTSRSRPCSARDFHGAAAARRGNPGAMPSGGTVRFTTSLRNGFIVQRIDNVWNQNPAAAAGVAVPDAALLGSLVGRWRGPRDARRPARTNDTWVGRAASPPRGTGE